MFLTSWMRPATLLLALSSFSDVVRAATADDWRSRSIYQIITDRFARADGDLTASCPTGTNRYCGGSFQGIKNQLDYIQGMGFTAIWISPVTTNINGSSAIGDPYHGFWPLDITTINSHFGTEADLKELSEELHRRDMYLMIDVVANNMAWLGSYTNIDYSQFKPWNDAKYFHSYCPITDYGNWTLAQLCWLASGGATSVALPDLNTESELVISTYETWARDMMKNYTVDGFRIDAAKHVSKPFWSRFQPEVGAYMVGEVFDGGVEAVCSFQSNTKALDGVLNYAMWYSIVATFTNTSWPMTLLEYQYNNIVDSCQDSTLLGTFSANHDVARIANVTKDVALQSNALAWTLMGDGIPIVYYGEEAAELGLSGGIDPFNREALWKVGYNTTTTLYKVIQACNVARNALASLATYDYWTPYWTWKTKVIAVTEEFMAIRKSYDRSIVTIVTNRGSQAKAIGPYTFGNTNFNYGDTIVDLIGCTTMKAGQFGNITITIPAGGKPMVWIPAKWVWNTTLCPSLNLAQWKGFKSAKAVIDGNIDLNEVYGTPITASAPAIDNSLRSSMAGLMGLAVAAIVLL